MFPCVSLQTIDATLRDALGRDGAALTAAIDMEQLMSDVLDGMHSQTLLRKANGVVKRIKDPPVPVCVDESQATSATMEPGLEHVNTVISNLQVICTSRYSAALNSKSMCPPHTRTSPAIVVLRMFFHPTVFYPNETARETRMLVLLSSGFLLPNSLMHQCECFCLPVLRSGMVLLRR